MGNERNILNRFYMVVVGLIIFASLVSFKLLNIQIVHGEEYEKIGESRVYKNFVIPANRGNLYDATGSLLATSVPKYDIHFDAITVDQKDFDEQVVALSKSLSAMFGNSAEYYKNRLIHARKSGNRYLLIAKNLRYSQYMKLKQFPIFKKGPYKGGLIAEQKTSRELPLGKLAERTVGKGKAGLEGAFNEYLKGKDGHRFKQKIANGLWKPLNDASEVDPKDGLDVISTIDVNIQDIVHHALLAQLEKYEADHGTAVLMEVKTGEIKGMANLGRTDEGKYYEKRNYAVWESQEPGSTFKLMAMVAALEDKVVDTAMVFDTEGGVVKYYNRYVRDSHIGGYGKISAARGFEVSSNTVFSKIITQGYKNNEKAFSNRLDYMGLNQKTGIEIEGEGRPIIPHPGDKNWYGTTLAWMSFGYGVSMTPLQILSFYNAVANDGVAVRPKLIKEIRDRNRLIESKAKNNRPNSIISVETAKIAQTLLKHTVEKGTAQVVASTSLSLAGKTGTAQFNYGGQEQHQYVASFAGYFPAENPQYSCIVMINQPNTRRGFYGGSVAGPVFKEIAEKIYNRTPTKDTLQNIDILEQSLADQYNTFYSLAQQSEAVMPDVIGLPAMDALSLLENMDLHPELKGMGKITAQSVRPGTQIQKLKNIKLTAN